MTAQNRVPRLALSLTVRGVCNGDQLAYLGLNTPTFFDPMRATLTTLVNVPLVGGTREDPS